MRNHHGIGRQRNAGQRVAPRHSAPQFQIVRLIERRRKGVDNDPHRLFRAEVTERVLGTGEEAFQRLSKRVEPGAGRHLARHGPQDLRVADGGPGYRQSEISARLSRLARSESTATRPT